MHVIKSRFTLFDFIVIARASVEILSKVLALLLSYLRRRRQSAKAFVNVFEHDTELGERHTITTTRERSENIIHAVVNFFQVRKLVEAVLQRLLHAVLAEIDFAVTFWGASRRFSIEFFRFGERARTFDRGAIAQGKNRPVASLDSKILIGE